ncbi:hypothetical protein G6F42_011415 [Rhizopus arrhizus]|nr:hypothetical protein G6F42_011415 [Rhizopus arrhizus]
MQISSVITLLIVGIASVTASSNITYKVVSLVPDNQTLAVIVDESVYPLTTISESSFLLHTGEAPIATSSYQYAILEKNNESNVIEKENFTRTPVTEDSTLNEYYGRSWNSMNLTQLPRILGPLPIINRIESKIHIEGEIPTIHFTGNQTAIDYIHANQALDIDVEGMKMTYISPNDVQTIEDVTFAVGGFSTRYLDKLSYKIKLPEDSDLYEYPRFKLRAMATDASYIRGKLVSEIAGSISHLNSQAIGLFAFAENFKSPWVRSEFNNGKKNSNQGTLFVCTANGKLDNATTTGNMTNSTTVISGLSYLGIHNNYILYDDRENERLVFSTQGFDLTLASRMLAVPKFRSEFDKLIQNYTTGIVHTEIMSPRINDMMTFLHDDVAWDKSLPRVGSSVDLIYANGINLTSFSFSEDVNGPLPTNFTMGVREWLIQRTNNLYEYFNATFPQQPNILSFAHCEFQ